jgi:hypothetical protein
VKRPELKGYEPKYDQAKYAAGQHTQSRKARQKKKHRANLNARNGNMEALMVNDVLIPYTIMDMTVWGIKTISGDRTVRHQSHLKSSMDLRWRSLSFEVVVGGVSCSKAQRELGAVLTEWRLQ